MCGASELDQNPYATLLCEHLRQRGVRVDHALRLGPVQALAALRRVDAVHIHWLEPLTRQSLGRLRVLRTLMHVVKFPLGLAVLRCGRVTLVWTVHNLRPHESWNPRIEKLLSVATLRLADRVCAHSHYAAERIRAELGSPRAISVIPHPSYLGVYAPDPRPRGEIRQSLGLEVDGFVYLLFGTVRRYKCILEAIEAFKGLEDERARLAIVGRPMESALVREVERASATDPRILVHMEFVEPDAVAAWHHASDALILNYKEVFSSGVLLLALSHGLPVIAPVPSAASELVDDPALVPIVDGRLREALEAAARRDAEASRAAALAAAHGLTWDDMAATLMDIYKNGHRPGTLA